jgi:serine/threonine protein kinase
MKGLEGSKLGRYELRFRVAQGGMSEVYLGYDRRVRRYVAVKVLYGSDEPFVRRFEREALAVGALSHEHILPLYDFGEQRPWYYLVMPFIEGGTLRDYIQKRERLTVEEAGSFLEQIASALQNAHDHDVVHRDVKPSNILLRPDGHAYLADFGLARAKLEAHFQTLSGAMIGTPEYMAPEQSNGHYDHRSDIYSLGIILYQMLTGQVPFTADSPVAVTLKHIQSTPIPPHQLNENIPLSIENVILKALAKAPEERYQEANVFALAYKKALWLTQESEAKDESLVLVTTGERNAITQPNKQKEITRETIAQITTQLDLPLAKPQLFLLQENTPSLAISYKRRYEKRRTVPYQIALLGLLTILGIGVTFSPPQRKDLSVKQHPPKPVQRVMNRTWITETAIVQGQATLAAQARIQATIGITPAIDAGEVLYYSPMTVRGGGWINDGKQCSFTPQGYHVSTDKAYAVAWCYTSQRSFTDAIFTVQAQLLYGDFCGLIFRLNPSSKAFYVLELNSLGEYRLQRAIGNDPAYWLTLIDWTYSTAIRPGYLQTNAFLVLVTGSHFRFYVNQQLIVSTFSDSAYTSGYFGLLVGGDTAHGTAANFLHAGVFQQK